MVGRWTDIFGSENQVREGVSEGQHTKAHPNAPFLPYLLLRSVCPVFGQEEDAEICFCACSEVERSSSSVLLKDSPSPS